MVNFTIFLDSDDNVIAMEGSGHAGFAPHGQDPVCAGASAIVQAAVHGLKEVLDITPGIEIDGGYIYFSLPDDLEGELFGQAQAIVKTAAAGLLQISSQFPEHVSVEREILL